MTTRTVALVAVLLAAGAAGAADGPEAVYGKMHAAALARDLDAMRPYATEARRADLAIPEVPRTYRITGKAASRDGNAVELRASGTADSVGLGYTQIFGVIGLVREAGEWKIDRLSWSTLRPGEYPEGYVVLQGPAPAPRSSAEPQVPRFKIPPSAPEPSRLVAKPAAEAKPDERSPLQRPLPPCTVKPVMTDDDLRACGATVPDRELRP